MYFLYKCFFGILQSMVTILFLQYHDKITLLAIDSKYMGESIKTFLLMEILLRKLTAKII